ncbi:MAG: hypothetical protein ACI8PD_002202, partial [Nitrospinales bacterium]
MKMKFLVFFLLLLFAIGCAGTTGGFLNAGYKSSSKGFSVEQL